MESWDLSGIAALDRSILVQLNDLVSRWPLLDRFVAWLVGARLVKFMPFVLVMCWFWFAQTQAKERNRRILIEGLLVALVALVSARVLALALPFRERPLEELHLVVPLGAGLRTWSSFPSDHAVVAFALAASLFRVAPRIGLWAFFHGATFICLPRIYFALHYPSDLVAGALIGVAFAFAVVWLPGRAAITGLVLEVERRLPPLFYAVAFFTLFEIAEMFDSVRIIVGKCLSVLRQLLMS
jgi:membrane-associated phospholipid phosphatase